MSYWILLATAWRSDGTPRPPRKFLCCVENGDPLAIAILCAGVVALVVIWLKKLFH
jgi:hypothetical protein